MIGARYLPPSSPVLDEDFDDDLRFEAEVLDSIRRCGTLDPHPNSWGVHDGQFTRSDAPIPEHNFPLAKRAPRKEYIRAEKPNAPKPLTAMQRRDLKEKGRFDWAFTQLRWFPHCTGGIAHETAVEFAQFGQENAKERGITNELWIWKRSRFLAGFR